MALGISFVVLICSSGNFVKLPPEGRSPFAVVISVVGAGLAGCMRSTPAGERGLLVRARSRFGGQHSDEDVDMVAQLGSLLPVFVLLVVYWGINGQMSTTFFNQGSHTALSPITLFSSRALFYQVRLLFLIQVVR